MQGLKNIHKHNIAKDSLEKISATLKKEFPYTKVLKNTIKKDGYYNVSLDHIRASDIDKFIKIVYDTSHRHGVGVGIPIMIRYHKIVEENYSNLI